ERGPFGSALQRRREAREKRRPGAERALGMLYLLRGGPGDAARADLALAAAGDSPESENDRGVALLARGDLLGALERFDRAQIAAARFNRALALEKLGLRRRAADAYAALAPAQTPWSAEAAERERSLRVPLEPAPASRRREVLHEIMQASTPQQLAQALHDAEAMPDLMSLGKKLDPRRLDQHAR